MAAALDQAVQRARHHLAGAGSAQHAGHDARDQAPGAAVLHGGKNARQHGGQRHCGGARRDGVGKEAVQDARKVEPGQHPGDLVGGEDMGGDEAAERSAEALLLVRDDGGMGDRNAEGVAEQRRDREPVGDAANKACLGGGLEQVGGGGGGKGIAAQGKRGHQHEKCGGEGPMAAQRAPGFCVGVRGLGWKGRAGIHRGARCTRMERVQCGGGAKGIHAAGRAPSRPDKGQQGRFVKPA